MDSVKKISQDLDFLSKLIRLDCDYKLESHECYDNGGDNCLPLTIFFKSEFVLESIKDLSQVFNTLQILQDKTLASKLTEQIQAIIAMDDKTIESNADTLVHMHCIVYMDRPKYSSTIKYLSRVQELILERKITHIKNLKQKFLSQSQTLTPTNQMELQNGVLTSKRVVSKDTVEAFTRLAFAHTHKLLEIESPNVVWSGSSAYYLGWAGTNPTELIDIDLFIIGTPEEKKAIIEKIKSNLIECFSSSKVIFKTCGSVGYIFIRGIPRIIQLICWGGPETTAVDVITHFDFDYLKSILKYDDKSNSYICYSMDCAVKSIGTKAIILANPKKVKPYRLAKAKANGFDTSIYKSIALELGPNDHYVMLRNRLAKEYYKLTSNLMVGTPDLDFDLENLFGVRPSPELNLDGSFDTYAHTSSTKYLDSIAQSISANEFKLTSKSEIFSEQKIVLMAKILSFYKYQDPNVPNSQLIISIDDLETINLINVFASECSESISRINILQVPKSIKSTQRRTSCIVKDGIKFVPENLTKASDSFYAKILEDVSPRSMVIKLRVGDYYSHEFVPGQTCVLQGVLRGFISKTHAGVSFKLK